MTKNRKLIYSIVNSSCEHMTADEIYIKVKKQNCKMVYATVYNCLSYLVEQGLIRRIQVANNADRYDKNTIMHDHFLCKKCGKVMDKKTRFNSFTGFDENENKIESYELIYYGICKECLNKEGKNYEKI